MQYVFNFKFYYIFFTLVPAPSIVIYVPNTQRVGQSLALESSITTVRGITSRVDIVWSSNGVELKRINETIPSSTNDNTELYEDAYHIPLLSTIDNGRIIECKIIIGSIPATVVTHNVTLYVTGKCSTFYLPLYSTGYKHIQIWLHKCIYM